MVSRNVKKCIAACIWIAVLVVGVFAIIKVVDYANGRKEGFDKKLGPLSSDEANALIEKLEGEICQDERYPSYYGGAALGNRSVVIYLTTRSKQVEQEIKEILGQEKGIVIKYVEYSLNDLNDKQQEILGIYEEKYRGTDSEVRKLLDDMQASSVRIDCNKVVVKVKNLSDEKVKEFKKVFGESGMIQYEEGQVVNL